MAIDRILGAPDAWATWAVAVTWQLAVLAALAWLCERVLRLRQAGARYGLWWFVLVAPLVLAPVRFALAERHASVEVVAPPAVARVAEVSLAAGEFSSPAPTGLSASVPEEVFTSPEYQAALRAHAKRQGLCLLALLAWLLGCATMGLRLVVGHRRVSRLVARSRLLDGSIAAGVFQRLGVSGVRLYESEAVGAPMVCSLRRPAIIFPEGWCDSVEWAEVESLLAHEVAHIKRRDVTANLVQRLIEIPLFFHPCVWLASGRIALAREELADGWALGNGAEADTYARALSTAAERAQAGFAGAAVGIAESKSMLRTRVEAIVGGRHVGQVGSLLAAVLLAVGLIATVSFAAVHVVDREQAKPKVSDARFLHDDTPLTTAQVNAALASAGMRLSRLSYHFPTEHRLYITIQQYRDGKRVRSEREARLDQVAGANSLTIAVREKPESVGFDFYETRGGMVGLGDLPLPAGGSRAWGEIWAGRELQVGRKVPVFSYASNRRERGGIRGSDAQDIAGLAEDYDFLYVVLAEVVLPGEAEGDASIEVSRGDASAAQRAEEAGGGDGALLGQIRAGASQRYHAVIGCRGSVRLVATRPASDGAGQEKVLWEKVLTAIFDGKRLRMSGKAFPGTAGDYEGAFDGEKTTAWIDVGPGADVTARVEAGLSGFTSGDFSIFVDPRCIGSYPIPGPDTDTTVRVVGREVRDGDECVVLDVMVPLPQNGEGAYTRSKVWVNLDKGYAVPKHLVWYAPSREAEEVLLQDEAVEFRQYGKGLWGPASYTRFVYHPDGTLEKKVQGTYGPDFEINTPVSEEELGLTLPSGMEVWDDRTKTSYTVP